MKHLKRLAVSTATVAILLGLTAGSASAATAVGYEEFADCPDKTVSASITFCVSATVNSGHLQMGSKDTPITDPIKILGGRATTTGQFFVGSFDGGRQRIPGGLVGITGLDWLNLLFPNSVLNVYAESELAGAPGDPLALNFPLPLKVRLINPLLTSTCYVGSNTNPINLNLTYGTTAPPPPNTPITGAGGTQTTPTPGIAIAQISNRILVDNAFAAPAAQGCGLSLLGFSAIDTLVNFQSGLPAAAGTNETIQNTTGRLSPVTRVFPPAGIETP